MKHLARNNIIAVSANSENPNFPAEMLLDDHPKRKYKASNGVNFVTLSADVIGGCTDIMIAGTNAINVTISARDPNMITLNGFQMGADAGVLTPATTAESVPLPGGLPWVHPDGDTVYLPGPTLAAHYEYASYQQGNVDLDVSGEVTQRSRTESLWVHLSEQISIPFVATIQMLAPRGSTLYGGVIRGAIAETYGGRNPRYGLSTDRIDYSIKAENSNGSRYYFKKEIVRVFDWTAIMTDDNAFKIQDNFDEIGEQPTAWKLTDAAGSDWVVFGAMNGAPKVSHAYLSHSEVSATIIEVL